MIRRTILAALCVAACPMLLVADDAKSPTSMPSTAPAAGVDRLATFLTGHFSSAAQAKADADYFDIHLHAVRIWPERNDGPWLYVEQARGDKLDAPYRQRVYRLSAGEKGELESAVYELPGTRQEVVQRYAGGWKDASKFADLTPQQLKSREGCTVHLKLDGDTFVGGTRGKGCESTLGGAAYATSEVRIDANGLHSWDRGFDSADKQVWGAEKGAYRFDRLAE